jgi:fucose permease
MRGVRMGAVWRALLAGIAFVGLGLPDGLLGVAWPSMRATFGVPLDALGALLTSFTIGYVTSSFAAGRSMRTLGLGGLLALSGGATGLSLLGYATRSSWWAVVALALVAGFGAGGIDTGVNTYAATHHGPRLLNVLHACWGIGAAGGPAIMTAVLAAHRPWQVGYVVVGVAQVALALVFAATRRAWPAIGAPHVAGAAPSIAATLRLSTARLGVLMFVGYAGLELGVGAWAFTLLTEGRGMAPTSAGAWTSLYWVGLTVGRVAAAALVSRLGPRVLLRSTIALLAGGLALLAAALSPLLDLAGLVLAGFAAGPIFPTLIARTPARLGGGHAANGVGFQIAGAALGQALWPSALGVLGAAFGLEALARGLVVLAVFVFVVNERLERCAPAPSALTV